MVVNQQVLKLFGMAWRDPICLMVRAIANKYGDKVHSIYIRGSVANGSAVVYVSDIDFVLVFHSNVPVTNSQDLYWSVKSILYKYPHVVDIGLDYIGISELYTSATAIYILKEQAVCIYGHDLIPTLPINFEKTPTKVMYAPTILGWTNQSVNMWKKRGDVNYMKRKSISLAKRLLRAAFEIVMLEEDSYPNTRNIETCAYLVSEKFPEVSHDVMLLLNYVLHRDNNMGTILSISRRLAVWIDDKYGKAI